LTAESLHSQHQRLFESNRYVYPVISRRSRGLSIGVNLNPDKVCNFHCVYCQVNRSVAGETRFVDDQRLLDELDAMLELASTGRLFDRGRFSHVPSPLQRLNDIAFSGDGEPTTYRNFDEIVAVCAALKRRHALDHVKMVLITNASMFHRPHVRRALEILDENNGEIWAKLEAGTQEYFKTIDRASIPLSRILENITQAAQIRPLVIQSLFMRIDGEPPTQDELLAYCRRLRDITDAGGQLKLIQVYTVARAPAEAFVGPLSDREVDGIAQLVRRETGLETAAFYETGS
jgi:wyosine [tRNA(Phe)-imidazoG37] synthetase (radical SAM superfamily)